MRKPEGRRPLRVAVAGLGNVGGETARLLHARRRDLAERTGVDVRLAWVCDAKASRIRRLGLPAGVRTARDHAPLLRDPGVDVVVELFGGLRQARSLVLGALAAGKHVVTANKHLLSRHWEEVTAAARKARRSVRFEAAVAGGIPIVKAIRSGLAADRIDSVCGIFNGTTNYILSRMAHEGCAMEEALREALRCGMAEADPTLDLNGTDTAHKVSILASMLTGRWVRPERVPRRGIEGVEAEDIRFAVATLERTVRLIGTVAVRWESRPPRLEIHVQPTLVPLKHPLAAVHGGYNAVLVRASSAEDLMFYGKGAGPGPAASAVLADIISIGRDVLAGAASLAPSRAPARTALAGESPAPYYIKLRVRDVPGVLSSITGHLGRNGVSIARIHQDVHAAAGVRSVPVMITTHAASRERIDRALRSILRMGTVARGHTCLRML